MEKINLKIALIDKSTEIQFLENFRKESNTKIISFDYSTHIFLKEKNIPHEISEKYSNNSNIQELQKLCYEFSKWYDLDIVQKNFSYSKINLAKLFSDQFIHPLVSLLKKFSEFQTIFQKYPESTFLASSDLLNITKIFSKSFIELDGLNHEFYFDVVDYKFQVGNKTFKLPISFNFYEKIKIFSEKIFNVFFGLNFNDLNSKFSLVVELNTNQYGHFLSTSKDANKKILYFGRRRPPIWDLNSFKIIKKSQCKIYTSKYFSSNNQKILEISKNLEKTFLEILESDDLKHFFQVGSISIISAIKPLLINLIMSKIRKVLYEIELAKTIFEKNLVDSVIVLSEIGMTEQIICNIAKQNKIPIFHLLEGFGYDTKEMFDRSYSMGSFSYMSDKNIVWGEVSKNYAIDIGKINSNKIIDLGSPRFDNLEYNEIENKTDFILLATMPPQIEEINGINTKNYENYLNNLENICEIVTRNKKQLVIKLHPTVDVLNVANEIPKKFPNVKIISEGDIETLIRKCSFVIVTGISTVMIPSLILQKPILSIPFIDYNFGIPSIYKDEGCKLLQLSEFEQTLVKIENDKNYRECLIENGNEFLKKCIVNRNNSSILIWEYIANFIKQNKS